MKKPIEKTITNYLFEEGEVYLFHRTDPLCPAGESLWGIFNRRDDEGVHLEIVSRDCDRFRYWQLLPSCYHYCREATRAEARRFISEQVRVECLANRFR